MKILVSLPAYNESKVIGHVLEKMPKKINGNPVKILVVDDGSSDNTATIALKKADIVLRHPINLGVGSALTTAFAYAKRKNYDILVTFDADGQHEAKDIKRIVGILAAGKFDIVNGSRMLGRGNMPLTRLIINNFANIMIFLISGLWSSDSQSGLRGFNKKAIRCLELKTQGMEISSEIVYQAKFNNLKYSEISIKAIYTKYSQIKGQKLSNAPNVLFKLFYRLIS